ncbi:DUF6883 domain-containing protein [Bradyrhizobium sp. NP1]|uniref:DUF6883 domain-containing protein n=1 Tax=Bradyrhizobium sp. NP1 TaxID=3049772 RepID=UPI0025A597E4|nr:DUF6883 domain-containing protein [Bradyrhizobium sp. NP1]WJR76474.1 hypothetical protein QOU61_27475 [Bradyrhizobium sp. NP1]
MPDFSLVPVDHQPEFENVSLVPVEHDPFGDDGVTQPVQGQAQAAPTQTAPTSPQPAQFQPQGQTQQPTTGASQSSPPTLGLQTTEPAKPYQNALMAGADDFFRSIPRGIVSGLNNAGSALARATQAEMGQDVDAPTPEQGMEILEKNVTRPLHRPESRPGKFGASVGEFLGNPASYLVPGSLPVKAGTAVLGGLGSEAGGQLGEGTSLELPLRIFGGVLGGLGAARLASAGKVKPPTVAGEGIPRSEVPPGVPAVADGVLPGANDARSVAEQSAASVADKLERYLLNPDHSDGGPKANWFRRALGFNRENAADLAKQLVFDESQAVQTNVTQHGTKFDQIINVTGANGRTIPIRTTWIIWPDGVPRLVTALPRS